MDESIPSSKVICYQSDPTNRVSWTFLSRALMEKEQSFYVSECWHWATLQRNFGNKVEVPWFSSLLVSFTRWESVIEKLQSALRKWHVYKEPQTGQNSKVEEWMPSTNRQHVSNIAFWPLSACADPYKDSRPPFVPRVCWWPPVDWARHCPYKGIKDPKAFFHPSNEESCWHTSDMENIQFIWVELCDISSLRRLPI